MNLHMANEQLTQYIETVSSQGFSEATIREVLAKNGWQNMDVNDAFSYVKLQKDSLMAQAPKASPMMAPQETLSIEMNSVRNDKILSNLYDPTTQKTVVEYNSTFSVGLAVVLIATMMILLNKIIDDAAFYTTTINAQLIFDALIIIPFLLIAFILRESFPNTGRRYLLISQPYFIVSGVLLVRLLWDTSKYILNTNATYGVYVVLILIILILTGSILFVQKYIKA